MAKKSKIVSTIQLKGGTGRSTLATTLAAGLSQHDQTTLVDCDPLISVADTWYQERLDAGLDTSNLTSEVYSPAGKVNLHDLLRPKRGYVVLDGAPQHADTIRTMLRASDLVLIPVAVGVDIWALADFYTLFDKTLSDRPDLDIRLVWNKYRAFTSSAQDTRQRVKKATQLPELKTKLGYRQAYIEALSAGYSAAEMGSGKAKEEAIEFVKEVKRILDRVK